MRIIFVLAMAALFSSCHRLPVRCRSEYLYPPYLASNQIHTPDPNKKCFYGQQIVVKWDLTKVPVNLPTEMVLSVRYGNRLVEEIKTVITSSKGYWVYQLVNRDYWCREGIVAYKTEVLQEGCVMAEWRHHLWADILEIDGCD